MSAADLGAAIAAALPAHHSLQTWVRMGNEVEETYDVDGGRCPRCGRVLPWGSVGPASGAFIGIPRMPGEIEAECLVDGRRGGHGRDFPLDELLAASRQVLDGLVEKGWKRYARRLEHALPSSADTSLQAEAVGQELERLRRFGPGALEPGSELETLVTSLARYWPRTAPSSER
jgi:hypothetical protein